MVNYFFLNFVRPVEFFFINFSFQYFFHHLMKLWKLWFKHNYQVFLFVFSHAWKILIFMHGKLMFKHTSNRLVVSFLKPLKISFLKSLFFSSIWKQWKIHYIYHGKSFLYFCSFLSFFYCFGSFWLFLFLHKQWRFFGEARQNAWWAIGSRWLGCMREPFLLLLNAHFLLLLNVSCFY